MMRIFVLFCFLFAHALAAQTTVFEFNGSRNDTLLIELGKVSESVKVIKNLILIENVGQKDGKIIEVEASCDCIVTNEQKGKVLQAGTLDTLIIDLNIENRPGKLEKTVKVTTDGAPKTVTIIIEGYVKPSFENREEQYPYKSGQLWFELRNKFVSVGNINESDTIREKVNFYNASSDTMKLTYYEKQLSPVSIKFEKRVLPPNRSSFFDLTFYPTRAKEFGHVKIPISFESNEQLYPKKELYFHAYVMPETPTSSDSIPEIQLDTNFVDFGDIGDSVFVDLQMKVVNVGVMPLEIKQLKTNCNWIKTSIDKKLIEPGQEAQINVVMDPRRRLGKVRKLVSVYTNDPNNPVVVFDVLADIKK